LKHRFATLWCEQNNAEFFTREVLIYKNRCEKSTNNAAKSLKDKAIVKCKRIRLLRFIQKRMAEKKE
jgi:hypothetical protein